MERNWLGAARVLAACAVLCGLFLMHGTPASAAEGCHGMPMATAQHVAAMAEHGPAVHAAEDPGTPGATCLSDAPQTRIHLPEPALMAVTLVLTAVCARATTRRRAPPPRSGRPLLLQVCIART